MRQAGIIAAAGIYALDHHRDRLVDDHEMARQIGEALDGVPGVSTTTVNTNMVFCDFSGYGDDVAEKLASNGILAAAGLKTSRLVTHLDLPDDTPARLVEALTN